MKVVVFHGSPRLNKNSDTLTQYFLKGLTQKSQPEITHFFLNQMQISPCQGCLYCNSSEGHQCKIRDDMDLIYRAYRSAELIVFATPMYWGYMTAQMKIMMDRMEALAWNGFGGKKFMVIMTYRHHYQSTQSFFERIAPFFHIDLFSLAVQTYNSETGDDIPIKDLPTQLEKAYQMGLRFG